MQVSKGRSGADSARLTETFTGEVWVDPVMAAAEGNTINNVTFQPHSRTYWHSHQFGQILHVTVGRGVICSEGQTPQPLEIGDYIWVPPGERHWHGGAPGSCVTHTAISLGTTTWGEPVSDEEYGQAAATVG